MDLQTNIQKNDVMVVQIKGKRLDAEAAVAFKQDMMAWIASFAQMKGNRPESGPRIVLNLESVTFIDSSGIGALVSILKGIGRGGDMVLCCVQETLMSSFRLTRMDRVFRFFPSETEAMNHFK